MGYKFTLILNREITDDESTALKEAGCEGATFGGDSLPTDASVPVTKMDFDDSVTPTLAEAIEAALSAVKEVPGLTVPGLTVPAQPATRETAETGAESSESSESSELSESEGARGPAELVNEAS